MNANPYLSGYNQDDIQKLYQSGSIIPNIDEYGNLIIQNVKGQLYSSSITIPLENVVYNPVKVETKYTMNLEDMKYISASSSSLGVGSDMTKEDLMFFTDGLKSQNFPFGKTEDDFIKFSVYNFDNTLVTESMIYPSGSYRN
jgi:hypothetical protein